MWAKYLLDGELCAAARLAELPLRRDGYQDIQADCLLRLMLASFDRLIEQTKAFVIQEEVNIFDLHFCK
ncbi:hypothetical protein V1522DRAFT_113895 [Lipomyces starkeyi]